MCPVTCVKGAVSNSQTHSLVPAVSPVATQFFIVVHLNLEHLRAGQCSLQVPRQCLVGTDTQSMKDYTRCLRPAVVGVGAVLVCVWA